MTKTTTYKVIPTAAATLPPAHREYVSATINFETAVLAAAKTKVRSSREFRSVSAFVNYHMAAILGIS